MRSRVMRGGWAGLALAVALLLNLPARVPAPVAVAAAPAPAPAAQGRVAVHGAVTESIGNAGLYIAMEKGYFADQGLDVDISRFPAVDAYRNALATGELDFGTIDINAGLFNVMARDIEVKFVADRGSTPPGQGWAAWMVRSDLADQIRDYGDLRGRKIAISYEGSYQHTATGRSLERVGLTTRDVEMVIVPITENNTAFANRAIDASVGIEPFNTIGVNNGWAVRWRGTDEVIPNGMVVAITYSPQFAGRRDVATRWMVAYLKGVRDYNTALRGGANRAEIIELLTRQTPLKDATLWQQAPRPTAPSGVVWPAIDPDGRVNAQSVQNDLDFFVSERLVQPGLNLARFIDTSFAEVAVQQLGPYQP